MGVVNFLDDKFLKEADFLSTELQMAILGIIGTLLGTVLGWLLNSLSQKGKVKVYIKKWEEIFEKQDEMGGFVKAGYKEAKYYHYNVSLDIYNSSRETKIMRDIHVVFRNRKKRLFSSVPKDDATRRATASIVYFDDISVVNIPAKSVLAIDLHGGLNSSDDEWSHLLNSNKVALVYTNDKNTMKTVEVCERYFGADNSDL